ncbi:hypothetical protein HAX54_047905 [Datura stramonium]|uniref:Uncharacterized protein n=1 Tax=Datura stramonium TaxID=4076 RepID=A0ABS8WL28_DATST|nr:hypothetical protein [Datura stramonium]
MEAKESGNLTHYAIICSFCSRELELGAKTFVSGRYYLGSHCKLKLLQSMMTIKDEKGHSCEVEDRYQKGRYYSLFRVSLQFADPEVIRKLKIPHFTNYLSNLERRMRENVTPSTDLPVSTPSGPPLIKAIAILEEK